MIQDQRTVLPLAGIFLSLIALLLVPVVIGEQARDMRDRIVWDQVPTTIAAEAFRVAAADETAAMRTYVATGDQPAAEWLARSSAARRETLATLSAFAPRLQGAAAARLMELEAAAAGLEASTAAIVGVPGGPLPVDTAGIWSQWEAMSASAEAFREAIESEMTAGAAQIDSLERLGFVLTTFLAFLAFASAMVTARLEGQIRAFARESERARREQQILLQSSGEGVFGIGPDARCTFLNPAGARLIGYPEEEVLGCDLRSLVLGRSLPPVVEAAFPRSRGFGGGDLEQVEEISLHRKDGEIVEAECLTSPMIEGWEVKGAVVTIRDISQRKAVERERLALLHTEQTLRGQAEAEERRARFLAKASALFSTSLDFDTTVDSLGALIVPEIADSCIIYLVDQMGAIQRLQPVHVDVERQRILAEQLDRYPPRIDSLIPPVRHALVDGLPALIHSVNREAIKGVPGDLSHQSVIGTVGLQSLIVVPLRARGRVIGAISYGVSASGRHYGPEDLTLAEDLATRAGLAIDNARLYQQSQAAVQARNEVLGIVSHDLRNPLNAVRFGAQALIRHWPPLGDGAIELNQLAAITKAADRMHRLIRDLLDVAQIDAGHLAVEPGPVPAGVILDDALELAGPAASDRSISVTLDTLTDLPVITVDGERILQVFSNLLNNAIKFSPTGSEVTVGAERREAEIVFRVRDRGRGIEPDHIPHIFDRFWKTRNGAGGAGLGLAIARGIVESHGGRIWVESVIGEGSTFYFTLPVSDVGVTEGRG